MNRNQTPMPRDLRPEMPAVIALRGPEGGIVGLPEIDVPSAAQAPKLVGLALLTAVPAISLETLLNTPGTVNDVVQVLIVLGDTFWFANHIFRPWRRTLGLGFVSFWQWMAGIIIHGPNPS